MATEVLRISVTDDGSARVVARNLENLGKSGKKVETTVDALRKAMSQAAKATLVFGTAATALAAGGLAAIVSAGNESSTALAKFNAILRASGTEGERTGATLVREARNIAKATGVAFEDVANTSAQLLTFYSIPEELRATALKLSIDAGTIFGSSASAAQQLGKALENPISGLGALSDSGIKFSAEQKRTIQILVETGRLYEAQKIILEEYAAAVEGAAEEVGTTLPGSLNILRETLKDAASALDAKSGLSKQLAEATTNLSKFLDSAEGEKTIQELAGAVSVLSENFLSFAGFVGQNIVPAFRAIEAAATQVLAVIVNLSKAGAVIAKKGGLANALIFGDSRADLRAIFDETRDIIAQARNIDENSVFRRPTPDPSSSSPNPRTTVSGSDGRGRPLDFDTSGQLTLKEQAAATKAAARELEKAAKARQEAIDDFIKLRGELDPLVEAGNRYAESLRIINAAAETGAFSQDLIAQAVSGVTAEFERARNAASAEAVDAFRRLQESLDPAIAAGREYARTLQIINEAAKTGAVSQAEIAAAVEGATKAYEKAREGLGAQGEILGSIAGQFTNALDSVVNFANGGAASISDFARSAVADLQRVFLQLLLVNSLKSLATSSFGGGAGGIFGQLATAIGGSGVFGGARANGGPVGPGKAFLVGEKGPELFVPPGRGNVIANDALGGAPPQVNVQVVNVSDPDEIPRAMMSREGQQAILNTISRNPQKSRAAMGG